MVGKTGTGGSGLPAGETEFDLFALDADSGPGPHPATVNRRNRCGHGNGHRQPVVSWTGVVEAPDGWAFPSGPNELLATFQAPVRILDTARALGGSHDVGGVLRRWPNRSDEFANTMNRIRKVVVSRSARPLDAWSRLVAARRRARGGVADPHATAGRRRVWERECRACAAAGMPSTSTGCS